MKANKNYSFTCEGESEFRISGAAVQGNPPTITRNLVVLPEQFQVCIPHVFPHDEEVCASGVLPLFKQHHVQWGFLLGRIKTWLKVGGLQLPQEFLIGYPKHCCWLYFDAVSLFISKLFLQLFSCYVPTYTWQISFHFAGHPVHFWWNGGFCFHASKNPSLDIWHRYDAQ